MSSSQMSEENPATLKKYQKKFLDFNVHSTAHSHLMARKEEHPGTLKEVTEEVLGFKRPFIRTQSPQDEQGRDRCLSADCCCRIASFG